MKNKVFEIKVLGSVSPYSKDNKNCPGFLVTYGNNKILLDCGNGITRLLNLPNDLNDLSIFISHLHKDHYGDLLSLGYASFVYHNLGILKNKVKLYIPLGKNPQKEYYDYLLIKNMKEQYFDIIDYTADSKINIDDLNISFLENAHDITCYSTKLENNHKKLVYTSDTGNGIAKQLVKFSTNADLLITESTFLRSDNQTSNNHLHTYQAAEIARLAKVKQLLLTHFWPEHNSIDYLNEARPIFNNTEVAVEGKVFRL